MKRITALTNLILFIATLLAVTSSCKKNVNPGTTPVTIETKEITFITDSSAVTGGTVSSIGDSRGICYSTNANPTINDSRIDAVFGLADYSMTLTGLTGNTTYHVRAFGIGDQIYYGQDISFTTRPTPVITTIAGNGTPGYNGDNIPALSAQLNFCSNIALDPSGNVYFSDQDNQLVRKLTISTGIITTIAGTPGVSGYSGDNGPATNAQLHYPMGLAVDAAGNVFFSDASNKRIRKIDGSTGIITTVAGGAVLNAPYGDGGPATAACLDVPFDVKLDASGNMLIADRAHSKIRKVDATTHIITTFAGGASGPPGGDGGLATSAAIPLPVALTINASGEVLISDEFTIRKVNNAGIITTVGGNGSLSAVNNVPATQSGMQPWGLATDNEGNIYFADYANDAIRKINNSGIVSMAAGNAGATVLDNVPPLMSSIGSPMDVTTDASGNLYLVGPYQHTIRKVNYFR